MIFRIKELAKKHAKIIVIGCFVDYADERIKKLVEESNKKCLLSMVSVKQIGNIRKAVNDLLNGKENIFIETGKLPLFREDLYASNDNLFLVPTAEVSMMGYHENEILTEEELPKKYVAFSPSYRREAGSYGKDEKGIYRVHEFMKVEQVILCKAEHQESVKWHEELTKYSEEILQALALPYRVVINCAGDLPFGFVKMYDIETWIPSEKRYRESHSSSIVHDFQTRRLKIRYKAPDGKIRFAHSLNNTAIATPRILQSILENYQKEDGSVLIPEVLRKYIGKDVIAPRSTKDVS